jgi:hypothetical protein
VQRRQIPWVNALAKGLHTNDVKAATELLAMVRQRLEAEINAISAANDG